MLLRFILQERVGRHEDLFGVSSSRVHAETSSLDRDHFCHIDNLAL